MRDATALQRRRRLMLLKSEATLPNGVQGHAEGLVAVAPENLGRMSYRVDPAAVEAGREQLFHESRGRGGVRLQIELPGKTKPICLQLDKPYALLGRDANCDLRVNHPEIRPRHAYLQWVDGRLFCTELTGEENAPPANGKSKLGCWLTTRPLQVGSCRVSLLDDVPATDPNINPLERSAILALEFPQVRLKFEGVEQSDNQWPVDRAITLIGRGSQCKLRLDHPEIPLVLASLLRTPSGCWLIDLAGKGTTLVNDFPVSFAPLDVGDLLQFGAFRAEVTSEASTQTAPQSTSPIVMRPDRAIAALATRHCQLLDELNQSLKELNAFLDIELLEEASELKAAVQKYVRQASSHHREMIDALKPHADINESASSASGRAS